MEHQLQAFIIYQAFKRIINDFIDIDYDLLSTFSMANQALSLVIASHKEKGVQRLPSKNGLKIPNAWHEIFSVIRR